MYLFALPVAPGDPAAAIAAIFDLVGLGKLITNAPCVTSLSAHQSDEVQRTEVNLQELVHILRFSCYLRAPRTISFLTVQPMIKRKIHLNICLNYSNLSGSLVSGLHHKLV